MALDLQGRIIENVDTEGNPLSPTAWLEQQNAITPSSLSPTPSLSLPSAPQEPDYQSLLRSIPQLSPAPTQAETQQTDIIKQLMETTSAMGEMPTAQLEAEQRLGVPEYQRSLLEMTNQIRSLQMEAAAIPIQIQQEFEGRGATKGGVAPIEAGRLRENTLKALQVSATAQAIQGNLMLAQAQADREVELRFAPLERKLEFLKTAYSINKDILDREDKKRSQELSFILNERERFLEEQKEERRNINNVAMTALQYGATPEVANRIFGANSFEEAIQIGGQFLGEPFRAQIQNQAFSQYIQEAQLGIAYAQLDLSKQSAITQAYQTQLQFDEKASAELRKYQGFQQFDVLSQIDNRLAQNMERIVGSTSPDDTGWNKLVVDNSFSLELVPLLLARSINPEISRVGEAMEALAATTWAGKTKTYVERVLSGKNVGIDELKAAINTITSNIHAGYAGYTDAVADVQRRFPGAVIPSLVSPQVATQTIDNLSNTWTYNAPLLDIWNNRLK